MKNSKKCVLHLWYFVSCLDLQQGASNALAIVAVNWFLKSALESEFSRQIFFSYYSLHSHVFKLLNYFFHMIMFLDVCKKWHWIPLAGPGARRNLVSVDRHGYDRRSQDLGEKKGYWLWQLAAENHRTMCIETEEHSWEGTAIHSIITPKGTSERKKIH